MAPHALSVKREGNKFSVQHDSSALMGHCSVSFRQTPFDPSLGRRDTFPFQMPLADRDPNKRQQTPKRFIDNKTGGVIKRRPWGDRLSLAVGRFAYSVRAMQRITWGRYHGGRRQSSQSNRHSTIGTRQNKDHEALPSSANVQSHLTSSFAGNGNAS